MPLRTLSSAVSHLILFGLFCGTPLAVRATDPGFRTGKAAVPNPSEDLDLFLRFLSETDLSAKELGRDLQTAVRLAGRGISKNIEEYGITSQDLLIEIAKIAAAESGLFVSAYIENYKIESEEARIEIAKIAAAQSPLAASVYIRNYGIKNPKALEEIDKIARGTPGGGDPSDPGRSPDLFARFLATYNFPNTAILIESVKIAASKIGEQVSASIHEYGIKEESILIEIAKIAAAQNGEGLSKYIQNYRITNPEALKEIAAIAAAQNPEGTSKYLGNYGLEILDSGGGEPSLETDSGTLFTQEESIETSPSLQPALRPVIANESQSEIPASGPGKPPAGQNRWLEPLLDVGAGYFFFTDSKTNSVYNQGGLELRVSGSYPVHRRLQICGGFEYIQKSGRSLYEQRRTTLRDIPLSLGLKAIPWNNDFFGWYVSVGPRYFFIQTKQDLPYVPKRMYGNGIGMFGNTGLLFKVRKNLTFDLFGEYSYGRIRLGAHHIVGEKLQVGGMTFGGAAGYSF